MGGTREGRGWRGCAAPGRARRRQQPSRPRQKVNPGQSSRGPLQAGRAWFAGRAGRAAQPLRCSQRGREGGGRPREARGPGVAGRRCAGEPSTSRRPKQGGHAVAGPPGSGLAQAGRFGFWMRALTTHNLSRGRLTEKVEPRGRGRELLELPGVRAGAGGRGANEERPAACRSSSGSALAGLAAITQTKAGGSAPASPFGCRTMASSSSSSSAVPALASQPAASDAPAARSEAAPAASSAGAAAGARASTETDAAPAGKPHTTGISATSRIVDMPAFEELRKEVSAPRTAWPLAPLAASALGRRGRSGARQRGWAC